MYGYTLIVHTSWAKLMSPESLRVIESMGGWALDYVCYRTVKFQHVKFLQYAVLRPSLVFQAVTKIIVGLCLCNRSPDPLVTRAEFLVVAICTQCLLTTHYD